MSNEIENQLKKIVILQDQELGEFCAHEFPDEDISLFSFGKSIEL